MSGSIINRKVPFLYRKEAPGFVLSSELAVIRCSYPKDGSTMHKMCAPHDKNAAPSDCVPGCFTKGNRCSEKGDSCFDPDRLKQMMEVHEEHHSVNSKCVGGGHGGNAGCQHNEIVLNAQKWKAALPRLIEAVFFPVDGDEAQARIMHAEFLSAYGLTAQKVPLLRLHLDRPFTPFELIHTDATQPTCQLVFSDASKFWRMWGENEAWLQSKPGDKTCWDSQGGDAFFERVLRAGACSDIERGQASYTPREGGRALVPTYQQPAPVLLGADSNLVEYCSSLVHERSERFNWRGDFSDELIQLCHNRAQQIVQLRPKMPAKTSMCIHMQWLVCAVNGSIPGQQGSRQMHFSPSPRELRLREWQFPTSFPCERDWTGCEGRYSTGDLLFAQACILEQICANGKEIFELERAANPAPSGRKEYFACDLNQTAYESFVSTLKDKVRAQAMTKSPPDTVGGHCSTHQMCGKPHTWCDDTGKCLPCSKWEDYGHDLSASIDHKSPPTCRSSSRK